jgi:hypothetical protein
MKSVVPVMKNEDDHVPVPSEWRSVLMFIVDNLSLGFFDFDLTSSGVKPIPLELKESIIYNLEGYGDPLVSLPDETWNTSVCQWELDHWVVHVDLYTSAESPSDLVLKVYVYEDGASYLFEVGLVYVP